MDAGVEIGEGQGIPRVEETVCLLSLASAPSTGCNPPASSKKIRKVSPLAAGEPAKGLMLTALL